MSVWSSFTCILKSASDLYIFSPASLQQNVTVILFEREQEIWCATTTPENMPSPTLFFFQMLHDCCVPPFSTSARFSLVLWEIDAAVMVFGFSCCFKSIQLRFLGLYRKPDHYIIRSAGGHMAESVCLCFHLNSDLCAPCICDLLDGVTTGVCVCLGFNLDPETKNHMKES